MEIWHFFVIFYDFFYEMCVGVYKSTIYTFVIRDKTWTPPLCCTKVYMLLLCFGSRKHPHPIHVRHFCVSPPPPPSSSRFLFPVPARLSQKLLECINILKIFKAIQSSNIFIHTVCEVKMFRYSFINRSLAVRWLFVNSSYSIVIVPNCVYFILLLYTVINE